MPGPRPTSYARWVPLLLAGGVALMAADGLRSAWAEAERTPAIRAADALPLYLSGAAVRDGEDPTTQAGLKAAYDKREMGVRAATFSNLYPASAGALIQPITGGTWEAFVPIWRALLLLGAVLAGAGAGLSAAKGRLSWLAAAVGAWLSVSVFPVTAECVALGQANLFIAGLLGVAMAAMSRGWHATAGGAAVLGAGIKLVPGLAVWPLLASRRWRGLAGGTIVGLLILVPTFSAVSPARAIEGLLATLQFQSTITPDWMNHGPAARWLLVLGDMRHTALGAATVALIGLVAWPTHRATPEQRRPVLVGSVALASAWLGADAAAFHVLYAPLFIPAWIWVVAWPLAERAPKFAWAAAALSVLPTIAATADLPDVPVEARLVVAGMLLWAAVAVRLVISAGGLRAPAWLLMGLIAGWGTARGLQFDQAPRGPAPDQLGDVRGAGLPAGVGHGGPSPGGGTTDGGTGVVGPGLSGQLLEEVLEPPSARRLTSHLVQAPRRWKKIDHPTAAWLVDNAPPPPAALVPYGQAVAWMAWELHATQTMAGVEAPASELQRTLVVLDAEARTP